MGARLSSSSPLDDDDLLREILLRFPPEPSALPRASLVCTRWRGVLSDPHFIGRFRKLHQKPPLLGFFAGDFGTRHVFASVLGSPNRISPARFSVPQSRKSYDRWDFRGCRHGLAVLVNDRGREAVVWDPLTGQHRRHRVPFPPGLCNGSKTGTPWLFHTAAMCADAKEGHVHGDCFASPFMLVLMCTGKTHSFACVYKSASGVWGDLISTPTTSTILSRPGILVGDAVYWLFRRGRVLVFDIERQSLAVIDKPVGVHGKDCWSFQLLRTSDDGSLGLAVLSKLSIQLWKRQSNSNGVVEWVRLEKIIQLEWLFPQKMDSALKVALMVGYDEDANAIVLATDFGVFMLQIESMQFITVSKTYTRDSKIFYPYRNFYTAGREVGWKWVNPKL